VRKPFRERGAKRGLLLCDSFRAAGGQGQRGCLEGDDYLGAVGRRRGSPGIGGARRDESDRNEEPGNEPLHGE
jgi:hypothetical protein